MNIKTKGIIGLTQFEVSKMIALIKTKDLGLNSSQKVVLHILSVHVDKNQQCFPSHKRLEDLTGLSNSTVKRCLDVLEESQYISIQHRVGSTGNKVTNLYTLNLKQINGGKEKIIKRENKVVPIKKVVRIGYRYEEIDE